MTKASSRAVSTNNSFATMSRIHLRQSFSSTELLTQQRFEHGFEHRTQRSAALFFVCGPIALEAMGVTKEQIHRESYG